MKTVSAEFQAHLDTGVTTVARCWKLTRQDGTVMGFTDHDEDLVVGGVTYEAASGFTASEVQKTLGLSVDNLTVTGALSSDAINESDLAAGLYDNAEIEIMLVNWSDTSQTLLLHAGPIGEIVRGLTAFQAELLGKAYPLNVEKGRKFGYSCDASIGDRRCGINTSGASYLGNGTVTSVLDSRRLVVAGLGAFANDWFQYGKLTWSTGDNAVVVADVKRHVVTSTQVRLELWTPMPETVQVGDTFTVKVGCDKQFSTCKSKFSNVDNFRGFPYMPGNDALMKAAREGEDLDGTSRYGN